MQVVNLQKSQWNSAHDASFTINLGIYWAEVQRILGKPSKAVPPKTYECTFEERIGFLTPAHKDHWWEVRCESDLAVLGKSVVTTLNEFGLPWLGSGFKLTEGTRRAHKSLFSTCLLKAILCGIHGQRERAIAWLGKAHAEEGFSRAVCEKVARRLFENRSPKTSP